MNFQNARWRLPREPLTVFFLTLLLLSGEPASSQTLQSFAEIYEPSGVIQTSAGEVLIVEDEGTHPLFTSPITPTADGFTLDPLRIAAKPFTALDFEGIAEGKDRGIFLITSHSANRKGKRKKNRQHLVKLYLKNQQISEMQSFDHLLDPIQQHLKKTLLLNDKTAKKLNIEGLAFTAAKNELLIGLRAPLYGGRAIVVKLVNPYAIFSSGQAPLFSEQPLLLDLRGAGIRAIDYDKHQERYLLAGEVLNSKGKFHSRVWSWDGTAGTTPTELRLPKIKGIKNIEGITSVTRGKSHFLLLVCDNGDKAEKRGANYAMFGMGELSQ